jgi:hypothetical protein
MNNTRKKICIKKKKRHYLKNPIRSKRAGGVAQVVRATAFQCEVLSSNSPHPKNELTRA